MQGREEGGSEGREKLGPRADVHRYVASRSREERDVVKKGGRGRGGGREGRTGLQGRCTQVCD